MCGSFQESPDPEPRKWLLSVRRAPICTKNFFISVVLVPVRTAVPVLRRSSYNSVGTRIQCGGTLSPLPTGRDSLGTGGDVQWHGLTVFLGGDPGRTVDSLLPSELAGGLYGCTAGLRNKSRGSSSSVLRIWHDTLPATATASTSPDLYI